MFITLAIDASTACLSLALLDGERLMAERRWTSSRGDAGHLSSEIRQLTSESAIRLEAISLYAAGIGPGNFTGLRISVATVQALALPSRTPVIGVCSADATGAAIRRQHQDAPRPVLIVGDARRDRLWSIPYPRSDRDAHRPGPPVTAFAEAAPLLMTPGLVIATPDWSRIGEVLEQITPPTATLIRGNRVPDAADIGRLAFQRWQTGNTTGGPIDPIYVHPPVFIAPVFTSRASSRED